MSCQAQVEQAVPAQSSIVLTTTDNPTATINAATNSTVTLPTETPLQDLASIATETTIPSATALILPTPLPTPSLTPIVPEIPCKNVGSLPNKAFPSEVDMTRSHKQRVALSSPFLYLAVEQYIGVFDISDPAAPEFLGFWDFPEWPDISTLQVHNGVAYFTSGTNVVSVNLSPQCRFETIAIVDTLQQILQLEIEDDRLYVDQVAMETEKNEVVIFSIVDPLQPKELGRVDLGQIATWSIYQEIIYSLGNKLAIFDVSDPDNPQSQSVNLTLDSEVLSYSPVLWKDDRLYFLWEAQTLTIISQLQDELPTVVRDSQSQIILGNLRYFDFQVSESYIFLGGYSCEGSCGSYVRIFDSMSGQQLSGFGFPQYQSPVHSYYEVEPHLIYAFTDNSLLIIDITNQEKPSIIDEITLIT